MPHHERGQNTEIDGRTAVPDLRSLLSVLRSGKAAGRESVREPCTSTDRRATSRNRRSRDLLAQNRSGFSYYFIVAHAGLQPPGAREQLASHGGISDVVDVASRIGIRIALHVFSIDRVTDATPEGALLRATPRNEVAHQRRTNRSLITAHADRIRSPVRGSAIGAKSRNLR
jgi:hypothetical protein